MTKVFIKGIRRIFGYDSDAYFLFRDYLKIRDYLSFDGNRENTEIQFQVLDLPLKMRQDGMSSGVIYRFRSANNE